MLKGGIKHHVEEEEKQLLPELNAALDRDQWLAIGDKLAEAKQALRDAGAASSPSALHQAEGEGQLEVAAGREREQS